LGILCGESNNATHYIFADYFLECGADNDFFAAFGENYTCVSSIDIPANPGNSSFDFDPLEIMTDSSWPLFASNSCWRHLTVAGMLHTAEGNKPIMIYENAP